jgi:hypothetical protein
VRADGLDRLFEGLPALVDLVEEIGRRRGPQRGRCGDRERREHRRHAGGEARTAADDAGAHAL